MKYEFSHGNCQNFPFFDERNEQEPWVGEREVPLADFLKIPLPMTRCNHVLALQKGNQWPVAWLGRSALTPGYFHTLVANALVVVLLRIIRFKPCFQLLEEMLQDLGPLIKMFLWQFRPYLQLIWVQQFWPLPIRDLTLFSFFQSWYVFRMLTVSLPQPDCETNQLLPHKLVWMDGHCGLHLQHGLVP